MEKVLRVFLDKEGFVIVPVNQDGLKTIVGNIEIVNDNGNVNAEGKKMTIGYERTIFTLKVFKKEEVGREIELNIIIADDKMKITYKIEGGEEGQVEIKRKMEEGVIIGPIELTIEIVFSELWAW